MANGTRAQISSIIMVLMALGLLGSVSPIVSVASTPQVLLVAWGSLQQPVNATAGDYNVPLYVVLSGDVINATLLPNSYQPFGTTSPIYGVIVSQSGTQTVVEFVVSLVSSGVYYVPLEVYYSTSTQSIQKTTLTLPIYVSSPSFPILEDILFNGNPFAVQGSGVTNLQVTVYNPSDVLMRNVLITLSLPDGVCSLNGNQYVTVLIPQVPPYSLAQGEAFVLVTTQVEPGTYSLAYKEQYTDPLGGVHSNMYYNATVYVIPSQPLRLEVSPVTAVPGGVATLIVKAKGQGMITALNLVSPFSILASNFTPNFPVNGEAVFAFKLLVPASDGPGIYPITINLNYLSYESDYQAAYNSFINVTLSDAQPFIESLMWQGVPIPGGTTQVSMIVVNPYDFPIYNVQVTFGDGVTLDNEQIVQVVQPMGYSQIVATVRLPNVSGTLNVSYNLSYYVNGQQYNSTGKIAISLSEYPTLGLTIKPSVLYAGVQLTGFLNISNGLSSPISQLIVTMYSQGIETISKPTALGEIGPHEWTLIPLQLSVPQNLPTGTYYVNVNVSYVYNGIRVLQNYLVPVYVIQGTNPIEVTVEPSVLYYQTPNSVVLSLANTLNETLRNVSITITTPSTAVQISPQNAYLSSLKPKSTASLNITVFTNLNAVQAVPVTLTVSYLSNEGLQVETIPLVLTFTGLIKLELLSPNFTYNNGSVMFSGTLLNVGNTQANNVIVYYPGGSLYLGQLPPNSPLNFEIPAQWNGKTASVNFIVSYETPLYTVVNTSYSYSYNLTIANSSTTPHTHEPKLFLSVYFYVIIVLIVLIIVLIIIRKRRRSNG